jgi:hypothetical protein
MEQVLKHHEYSHRRETEGAYEVRYPVAHALVPNAGSQGISANGGAKPCHITTALRGANAHPANPTIKLRCGSRGRGEMPGLHLLEGSFRA